MKVCVNLIFATTILASCQRGEHLLFNEGHAIVTGKIENPTDKTITFLALDITGRRTQVTDVDSAGQFRFDLDIQSSHDNYLNYAGDLITIFLEPNDSTYIVADGRNFKESSRYFGDQAKFNKCIQLFSIELGKALIRDKFWEKKKVLSPNEFKGYASVFFDQLNMKIDSIVDNIKPESKNPRNWLRTFVKYRQAEELLEYGKDNQSELDARYYDFIEEYINPNWNAVECSQYFDDFIRLHHIFKLNKTAGYKKKAFELRNRTSKGLEEMIDFVDQNETITIVKKIILTKLLNDIVDYNLPFIKSIFDKYSQIVTDVSCQNFLLNRITERQTEPKTTPSLVKLESLNHIGGIFRKLLKNHRSKVLFLDVWGTWCRPCINAFPQINKLHHEFKDERIEFVFLCIGSSKKEWLKTRNDHNLPGTHYLLSDDQYAVLSNQFNILGLPRYIIIDSEGNVANANASKLYGPEFKEELQKLLHVKQSDEYLH